MRCDVLAVGTELLLGQIVDTNSAWIGEQLAAAGIDSYLHVQVGDNQARVVEQLRGLLADADAVIVCGGLGPTQDDITREAIAEVMGTALERRDDLADAIREMFMSRGRAMPASNLRQADVPKGGEPIPNPNGTAPGLLCPVGDKIVYAVPGVPHEMQHMVASAVVPHLLERSGERGTILSRSLKTWGMSESGLAERIAGRVDTQTNPTIAFLARGIEGLVVRISAKAATGDEAQALIGAEEAILRDLLGDIVFAVDDETMESVVSDLLRARGWTLGLAESLTGGLVGSRISDAPGSSEIFRGSIVSYATEVKRSLLGVTAEQVVSAECAIQMAEGARRVLGADVGLGVTGVAGPTEQEGQPVGTVYFGLAMPGREPEAVHTRLPGDRLRIRQFSTISLLNLARLRLLDRPGSGVL
ncbi:MAG: nicotinamide-nucleotide amidase [Actinomycetota bacterium]|jgi:nicotinamide-nucleotide amidase|nr:nicotinamide-nucleotide amidase [Actinomycetota bacterium]MDQ1500180.1 nicotinamide-nucleotide amidase [Actinomycetota bacterium]MDQ1507687.1 nicotinamide-nucleotide amidase [Actinomycetota bacterium]